MSYCGPPNFRISCSRFLGGHLVLYLMLIGALRREIEWRKRKDNGLNVGEPMLAIIRQQITIVSVYLIIDRRNCVKLNAPSMI